MFSISPLLLETSRRLGDIVSHDRDLLLLCYTLDNKEVCLVDTDELVDLLEAYRAPIYSVLYVGRSSYGEPSYAAPSQLRQLYWRPNCGGVGYIYRAIDTIKRAECGVCNARLSLFLVDLDELDIQETRAPSMESL